ncbi:30S ribosomal protein S4 [Alicyclobacillus tolerans]|nr:30S ribosomal protein S4 [Alicyclobacillus tolerans]
MKLHSNKRERFTAKNQAKHRMCRIVGRPLCGLGNCPALKRPYPPGQHGQKRNSRKNSEFGFQLLEKQKLKFIYGIRERQFHRFYQEATKNKNQLTGSALLQRLETRLDSIVYRLGYARTIHGARQLVVHGHFTVNEKRVDRPSYHVPVGSVIRLTDKAKKFAVIIDNLSAQANIPTYLAFDREDWSGGLLKLPERSEVPVDIDTSLIVEYYARV